MSDAFASKFHFSGEHRLCIGVEEDVWTVSRTSGLLTPLTPQAFSSGYEQSYPYFKPALPAQQIEAITPICRTMSEAKHALRTNAFTMERFAARHGTHLSREPVPTKPHSISFFRSPRNAETIRRLGARLGSAYVAGLRVHVGIGNHEEAILAMNVLRQHLPSLLTLSARSPFTRNGYRYASYRHIKYAQMAGPVAPPFLAGWNEFKIAAQRGGFADDPRRCMWGARLTPHGTIEMRVCDVQNSYSRTLEIVALTRMLVRGAIDRQIAPERAIPAIILEDWLMQAARGTWRTTLLTSVITALSKHYSHHEELTYVKRLLP